MKSFDRFAVLSSTAGSVFQHVLAKDSDFRARLKLVITDRSCGAENVSAQFGIQWVRIEETKTIAFSNRLEKLLINESIDAVFLFFSRILSGNILDSFSGRLINFHPSLLPAFPGLRGFEDGWRSSVPLLGSTVHFLDFGVDTGPVIQQTFLPVNRAADNKGETRHRIFLQQCASLAQVSDWLARGRLRMLSGGEVVIDGANYKEGSGFVPALEKQIAKRMVSSVSQP